MTANSFRTSRASRNKSTRLLLFRAVFTILVIATVIFIFANSSEDGEESGGKSAVVTEYVNKGLERTGFSLRLTEHRVRKMAHFCEYMLLGFLLMPMLRVYTPRYISHIGWPLFLGLLVPVLDESFQLLVPGRSGQLTDVLIDFGGAFTGIVLGLFLLLLFRAFWDGVQGRPV